MNLSPKTPVVVGVTPGDHGTSRDLVSLLEGAQKGGLNWIILREPHLPTHKYVAMARYLAPIFANGLILHGRHPDAVAIAEKSGWGLHMPSHWTKENALEARKVVTGPLGMSCHSLLEVAKASAANCDYATISPIFPPNSKPNDSRPPLGIVGLEDACRSAPMPLIALGGLDRDRARACIAAGASGIAAMGALFPKGASPEGCQSLADALCKGVRAGLSPVFNN